MTVYFYSMSLGRCVLLAHGAVEIFSGDLNRYPLRSFHSTNDRYHDSRWTFKVEISKSFFKDRTD